MLKFLDHKKACGIRIWGSHQWYLGQTKVFWMFNLAPSFSDSCMGNRLPFVGCVKCKSSSVSWKWRLEGVFGKGTLARESLLLAKFLFFTTWLVKSALKAPFCFSGAFSHLEFGCYMSINQDIVPEEHSFWVLHCCVAFRTCRDWKVAAFVTDLSLRGALQQFWRSSSLNRHLHEIRLLLLQTQ